MKSLFSGKAFRAVSPCVLLFGLAGGLRAQGVNPVSYDGSSQSRVFSGTYFTGHTNTLITAPGSYSSPTASDFYGDSSVSQGSVSLAPAPTVTASAAATDPTGPYVPVIGGQISPAVSATAQVQLVYYFDIAGPVGGSVTLRVNALGGVAGTPSGTENTTGLGGSAAAVFEVNKFYDYTANDYVSGNVLYDSLTTGNGSTPFSNGDLVDLNTTPFGSGATPVGAPEMSGTPFSDTFSVNADYTFQTNVEYEVLVSASASAFFDSETTGSASYSAFLDPTFELASTVTDPTDYNLIFSSGIGDTPPSSGGSSVPDSGSTLALLGVALVGMVASAGRRSLAARSA